MGGGGARTKGIGGRGGGTSPPPVVIGGAPPVPPPRVPTPPPRVPTPPPKAPTPPPKAKIVPILKPSPVPAPPLPTVPRGDARTFRKASDDELNDHLKLLDPLGTTPMHDAVRQFIEDELKNRAGFPALSSPAKKTSTKKKK
jgi:hypothetical protein